MTAHSGRTTAFSVVGVSASVRNDDPAGIAGLWEKYRSTSLAARKQTGFSDDVYCVYHDYEGDQSDPFRMTVGRRVAEGTSIPDALTAANVPAQPVMIYDASGEQPAALVAVWQRIWNSDIPRAFAADFEVHDGTDPNRVFVHVGIEP